jgi:hypothetical protein
MREVTAGQRRAGVILSGLVVLFMLADAAIGLFAPGKLAAEMQLTGWDPAHTFGLGVLTLACTIVYAVPRTAVLGAILLTGFLGGAICTHVRVGEIGSPPQIVSLVLGIGAWAGLWLRDARVRSLLPLNS